MNFDPVGERHVSFISQKRPRIIRSGESAVGCGGRSFDVAFIYPFSKKKPRESQERVRCVVTDSPGWRGAPEAERREKDGLYSGGSRIDKRGFQ